MLLRMDMSGAHMSSAMTEWADSMGIKIDLVPKLAHHRLALLERNHAVRRHQLWVFERTAQRRPGNRDQQQALRELVLVLL